VSMTASALSSGVGSTTPSVRAVTFSPDGTLLATTGSDGTARLWDAATQHQIGPPMTPPKGISPVAGIGPVAFSPDGQTLAIGDDQIARQWNIAFPAGLHRAVCSIASPSLTPQVWATYIPSLPYQKVCP
jgi:eukaryotic-like serine/threonine-protein kinase